MPLYQLNSDSNISQIKPSSFKSEKELQKLFEGNLEKLLGVRFIASEFTTGDRQRGRIDSLGLDRMDPQLSLNIKNQAKKILLTRGFFIWIG